ncbi:MAG: hypothetical protein ACU0AT_12400 [Tranquillimonas sp.]
MKRATAAAIVLVLAGGVPVQAQPAEEEGLDLLSRGIRLLMQGLFDEMEPAMRELAEALRSLEIDGVTIEDLGQYHPPQVLPNGDIILRRKTPLENGPTVPRDPAVPRDPGAEVEL